MWSVADATQVNKVHQARKTKSAGDALEWNFYNGDRCLVMKWIYFHRHKRCFFVWRSCRYPYVLFQLLFFVSCILNETLINDLTDWCLRRALGEKKSSSPIYEYHMYILLHSKVLCSESFVFSLLCEVEGGWAVCI